VGGDEVADDFQPRIDYLGLAQAFKQHKTLHQIRHNLRGRLPPVGSHFSLGQAAPFSDHGGAKRNIHGVLT